MPWRVNFLAKNRGMKQISRYHVAFITKIKLIYVATIFDFFLFHMALQTTVIVVLRGAKEHLRMKVK